MLNRKLSQYSTLQLQTKKYLYNRDMTKVN